jgi:DNA-binding NarL/FixJ family response regulator
MYDNENAIIRMLKNGARGYVLKDIEPNELKAALDAVRLKGFYYSEVVTGKLLYSINHLEDPQNKARGLMKLNEREIEFLKLSCSEMTYKEIADLMFVSPRTVDGYRQDLFEKLNIKSRVGLAMYAIKNGIINL